MKTRILYLSLLLVCSLLATAQVPQAFKYQTVVRDGAGQVLANQTVGLRINLIHVDTLYSETHTVTTNAFGLVNLEVGRGVVQYGQFDTIHWEQQPIYIHVSLDITGGFNYLAMGSSELLSVPYALYAANAAGSGLPAGGDAGDILYHDGTTWQQLEAGSPGAVLTMGANGIPYWNLPPQMENPFEVILSTFDTIYVSPVDNSTGVRWGGQGIDIIALPNITTTAAANLDFEGQANTDAIVAQLGDNSGFAYAAKVCADLVAYGYDDWYLPAAGELNEIYLALGPNGSGQITTGNYWSSSEVSDEFAWIQVFAGGDQVWYTKAFFSSNCRCVRKSY